MLEGNPSLSIAGRFRNNVRSHAHIGPLPSSRSCLQERPAAVPASSILQRTPRRRFSRNPFLREENGQRIVPTGNELFGDFGIFGESQRVLRRSGETVFFCHPTNNRIQPLQTQAHVAFLTIVALQNKLVPRDERPTPLGTSQLTEGRKLLKFLGSTPGVSRAGSRDTPRSDRPPGRTRRGPRAHAFDSAGQTGEMAQFPQAAPA